MNILLGKPDPLGATWDGHGVNFAIFSENATSIELLLFDGESEKETERIQIAEKKESVWSAYVPDIQPGQLYAYRVYGEYAPRKGLRFNPNKVLIDPYARAIAGSLQWDDSLLGYNPTDALTDLSLDLRDSSPYVPKSVVIDNSFDWEDDRPPKVPWSETVIYEAHVKGLTKLHPKVSDERRGTFAGLSAPPVLDYLKDLGITALELLPVQYHANDRRLASLGLTNYWGYNTIGYFAPDCRFSSSGVRGEQVREFKEMVKALHQADIEVILDVVYNHTGEGDHLGPTISFRGLDNSSYYHLSKSDPRLYIDFTGTGNSLNASHPMVLQLVIDSLRYWVEEMHVDGFRFDLTTTLGRENLDFNPESPFFKTIENDTVLSHVKLIAEPWDIGAGGYQLGNFPRPWAEWNGKYRDAIRRFWRGDGAQLSDMAHRLTGSGDLYRKNGRGPHTSINFITCHDGFTLADLVSYNSKHNEANMESNRDGTDDNLSWNCGAEGATEDDAIIRLRRKQTMNLLATLFLSHGVPMLLSGDEVARTQRGNNNSYCQDNEIIWINWNLDSEKLKLLDFIKSLIKLRKVNAMFRKEEFSGNENVTESSSVIKWLRQDGETISADDWNNCNLKTIGMMLREESESDTQGYTFLLLLNPSPMDSDFQIPAVAKEWELLINTSLQFNTPKLNLTGGAVVRLEEHSLVLLRST